MKREIKLVARSFIIGVGFALGIIAVYAATNVISSLGGNNIESGDKIGSGWFQEVDVKLSEAINWINNEGKNKVDENKVVKLTGNQDIGGKKSFSGDVSFSGNVLIGDVNSNVNLDVEGMIRSYSRMFVDYQEGKYTLTPFECLNYCESIGLSIATSNDLVKSAANGYSTCKRMWYLRSTDGSLCEGYPMASEGSSGCGGSVDPPRPRLINPDCSFSWDTTVESNCSCN